MRGKMKDSHTQQKEDFSIHHRLKESQTPQKTAKKSLNTPFILVSEESDNAKEVSDFSPISEISEASISSQTSQSSVSDPPPSKVSKTFVEPIDVSSSETPQSSVSDPTQAPKVFRTSDEPVDVFTRRCIFHKPDGSMEVEIVSDLLKEARTQVLNSTDVDKQSKKLLDALVQFILVECCALPEERDCYSELVSAKGRIVFLCFLLWSFIVYVIFIFGMSSDRSYIGPPPT